MKHKIYPKGFSSILYLFFSILCISFVPFSTLLIFNEDKRNIEIVLPIFIVFDLLTIFFAYLLFSSIRIVITIECDKLMVKGQPIRYKNRIQHSFSLNIKEIRTMRIAFDEYNSKGEKFSSLNPRHMYQDFVYIETNDGKIYKIWIKHFSKKQVNKLLHIND